MVLHDDPDWPAFKRWADIHLSKNIMLDLHWKCWKEACHYARKGNLPSYLVAHEANRDKEKQRDGIVSGD